MKDAIFAGIIACALAAIIGGIVLGLNRTETVECYKWQKEAREYPGYYLTEWQAKQCEVHNITIDAPVK